MSDLEGVVVGLFTTLLEILGLVAITVGVAFIFWPASLIVGGVAVLWLSREIERKGTA